MHDDAQSNDETKDVGTRKGKLIIASESEFDRDTETFDGHNRDGTDHGADGDVDYWIGATVSGDDDVDHDEREYKDSKAVHQETCNRDGCLMQRLGRSKTLVRTWTKSIF